MSDGVTPFTGQDESISVYPDACTAGTIKVWGHSDCGNGYDSNPSSLTVTRTFPSMTIQISSSNTYIEGNTSSITLTVPSLTCAEYSWTIPSSWTFQGSSTSYSVTVIPDGCTDGNVTCLITIPSTGQTKPLTESFTFVQYPADEIPYMSGSYTVCTSGSTFSIENLPDNTATIAWTNGSYLTYVSGQNSNSYTVTANGSGISTIGVTITSGCGIHRTPPLPLAFAVVFPYLMTRT